MWWDRKAVDFLFSTLFPEHLLPRRRKERERQSNEQGEEATVRDNDGGREAEKRLQNNRKKNPIQTKEI